MTDKQVNKEFDAIAVDVQAQIREIEFRLAMKRIEKEKRELIAAYKNGKKQCQTLQE